MTVKALEFARYHRGLTYFANYDADSETLVAATPAKIEPDKKLLTLLIYPETESATIKLNGNDKLIFLPADTWTPIMLEIEEFTLESSAGGDVHWAGYYL